MICRIWSGRAAGENAVKYERIVRQSVIPDIEARNIPGFLGIDLMKRSRGEETEFQTIMWFEDIAAVAEFAGADFEASHVPADARAVLASFDERAVHFEVLDRRLQSGAKGVS